MGARDARSRQGSELAGRVTSARTIPGSVRPIGVLGGTFDPVHIGHLRIALELLESASLAEVRFVLAARPPHRPAPKASAELRLRMLEAAVADEPRFVVDRRELDRPGPSYTVDTLASLAEEVPDASLCLLLGMDAFLGLPSWHRWPMHLELAHLVVAHRPGSRPPDDGPLGDLLRERLARSPAELSASKAGRIHMQAVTPLDVSSTAIRTAVKAGKDPRYLVPDAVRRIILETECYAEKETEKAEG